MKYQKDRLFYLKLGVISGILFVGLFGFFSFGGQNGAKASVNGPVESHTGAPDEGNCSACHSGNPVNKGGGFVAVTGLPANYRPAQQYPVTVTVDHFNATIFGFQVTSIDTTGLKAGNMAVPAGTPAQMQEISGFVGGNLRQYMEHTLEGVNPPAPNTKSWTFNWTAPATRKGKVSFYAAGNGANGNGDSSGDFIYTGSSSTYSGTAASSFDTDEKTDLAVYRPGTTVWYSLNSTDGAFNALQFGSAGDKIVPGDYDGDRKADKAIWRPSNGVWFILMSSNNQLAGDIFGATGDIPMQGDYDGDGKTDLGIYRPSNGTWYIRLIANGNVQIVNFGLNGDIPVAGDYDGDGKTDIAVFRPGTGNWYILQSSNGSLSAFNFGLTGDKPVSADYDGDFKTDPALFRPSSGVWYILKSTGGLGGNQFGISTDTPAPGDYNGDGLADLGIFRDGTWFVMYSGSGNIQVSFFGSSGDIPVQAGYLPQ